jgi:hypothetical protein
MELAVFGRRPRLDCAPRLLAVGQWARLPADQKFNPRRVGTLLLYRNAEFDPIGWPGFGHCTGVQHPGSKVEDPPKEGPKSRRGLGSGQLFQVRSLFVVRKSPAVVSAWQ